MPVITAFADSPDRGQGQARDMRVRWALEEVGLDYQVRLVSFTEMKGADYRALHPFGQIPVYQDGPLVLFESGAIVLHLAEGHPGLLPEDPVQRSRARAWVIAALNTVEPPILELANARLLERDMPWAEARLPLVQDRVRQRLGDLARWLGEKDWLEAGFTAGDLMMVGVLRRLWSSGLLAEFPAVQAYVQRGEARPAFRRAYAAQERVFLDRQRP